MELRHELETIFRRHFPPDGFFGWCVVAGTAQPFLAQADYFRNAVDIGHGDWETAKRIAMWTANTRLFLQEAPCLPNIDSIGWSAAFDETCWLSWLNFCAISGGALEVSGDLRELPEARLERLSRTLALSDPDRRVRCPGLDSARGTPPSIWIATGDANARLRGGVRRGRDRGLRFLPRRLHELLRVPVNGPGADADEQHPQVHVVRRIHGRNVEKGSLEGQPRLRRPHALHGAKRAAVKFGRGSLVWHPDFIAQDKPEEESQASLDFV